MASSFCLSQAQLPSKVERTKGLNYRCSSSMGMSKRFIFAFRSVKKELLVGPAQILGINLRTEWSLSTTSTAISRPNLGRAVDSRRGCRHPTSCLLSTRVASSAFTFGTLAVLPFYAIMIVAPRAEFTKKLMRSITPYILMSLVYLYVLYLSWRPDTMRLIFSTKNGLPELASIAKLFSREMGLASAWIHLLAMDLFIARYVYLDGLQNNVAIRHSVPLCLLSCPLGVIVHYVTKALSSKAKQQEQYASKMIN